MFQNTRVEHQNNTAMSRSSMDYSGQLTPGAPSFTPLCISKCIQAMKCGIVWNNVEYMPCLFKVLMLATNEELTSAAHASIASSAKELGKDKHRHHKGNVTSGATAVVQRYNRAVSSSGHGSDMSYHVMA